jgi:hypothetical protein
MKILAQIMSYLPDLKSGLAINISLLPRSFAVAKHTEKMFKRITDRM